MPPKFTALVMAANRPGVANPVAALQDKTHKAQVDIAGRTMLLRVLDCLRASPHVGRIVISVEDPSVIEAIPEAAAWLAAGEVETVRSEGSLFRSLRLAVEELGPEALPMVVTTADNALMRTEMIDDFCCQMLDVQADLAVAMTPWRLTRDRFPGAERVCVHHDFRDGPYSTCNIYGLGSQDALKVAQVLEGGGQFRKKRLRILRAFGLMSFVIYALRLKSFRDVMAHVGRRFGVRVAGIVLPYAEAPIDVDNAGSFYLAEEILREREGSGSSGPPIVPT